MEVAILLSEESVARNRALIPFTYPSERLKEDILPYNAKTSLSLANKINEAKNKIHSKIFEFVDTIKIKKRLLLLKIGFA